MSLIRWRNGQDLLNLEKEMSQLFDMLNPFGRKNNETDLYEGSTWAPLTDILEDKDHYSLLMDIPGLKKEDVKISLTNGRLVISGERKSETESKDRNYHRVERVYGEFYRSFQLPDHVHQDKISAEFENGQLRIAIPKMESVIPREIPILTR